MKAMVTYSVCFRTFTDGNNRTMVYMIMYCPVVGRERNFDRYQQTHTAWRMQRDCIEERGMITLRQPWLIGAVLFVKAKHGVTFA